MPLRSPSKEGLVTSFGAHEGHTAPLSVLSCLPQLQRTASLEITLFLGQLSFADRKAEWSETWPSLPNAVYSEGQYSFCSTPGVG
jgi:hypothetical protein